MSHRTTVHDRQQALVTEMTQRMTTLVQHLSTWLFAEPRTLAAVEQQVVRVGHDLLTSLFSSLLPLLLPVYDAAEQPCA